MEDNAIYTIGYGNRSISEFIDILKSFKIQYLIDVRSKPYSKFNPDFKKDQLKLFLKQSSINYIYMGKELGGIPDDPSCYQNEKVEYKILSAKDYFIEGINRLVKAYTGNYRVVLMCSEFQAENCHRSKLLGQELVKRKVNIKHIDKNGELMTQDEALLLASEGKGNLTLFGDNNFTSNNSYI